MTVFFTKYHGAKGRKGSRIIVTGHHEGKKHTHTRGVDNRYSVEENHKKAMIELALKLKATGRYFVSDGATSVSRVWVLGFRFNYPVGMSSRDAHTQTTQPSASVYTPEEYARLWGREGTVAIDSPPTQGIDASEG